jgi:Hint domain
MPPPQTPPRNLKPRSPASPAPPTADYNALGLTSFENVLFGTGGNATLLVSNADTAGVTLGVTISGFDQTSEVIDLTGTGNDGTISNFDTGTDQITVTGSSGNVTLQFDSIDLLSFTTTTDGSGDTDLSIACYCRGTLILTERDEVVESLAIGDRAMTISGAARPIRWIGQRAYDGRFVAGNKAVLPICAGALAAGVPARDLWVSPGHSLYIDGVLGQSEHLLNGATRGSAARPSTHHGDGAY